ncbi:hypothetical protein GGR56DRAFT_673674 [Xylariaceae sp. FL0804]|nr:hypothetical protein GGR56DRAFT_673674 [Xylariaceae sp. FL0804]
MDSVSMKTMAFMTMPFLPATLFAGLIAVSSLDSCSEEVIQGDFWVYWAFTLLTVAALPLGD